MRRSDEDFDRLLQLFVVLLTGYLALKVLS
jgi:hypothetical protein